MKLWVVRIILMSLSHHPDDRKTIPFGILDCLRHPGGVVQVHENEERQVFDLFPPRHISKGRSKLWAENVASRMTTFGINAAVAPEWREYEDIPSPQDRHDS